MTPPVSVELLLVLSFYHGVEALGIHWVSHLHYFSILDGFLDVLLEEVQELTGNNSESRANNHKLLCYLLTFVNPLSNNPVTPDAVEVHEQLLVRQFSLEKVGEGDRGNVVDSRVQ